MVLEAQKHPVSGSAVDKKCLVIQRGQRGMTGQVQMDRKVTVTEITRRYSDAAQKSSSKHSMSDVAVDVLQLQQTTGSTPVSQR